jgi:hypothetical protein
MLGSGWGINLHKVVVELIALFRRVVCSLGTLDIVMAFGTCGLNPGMGIAGFYGSEWKPKKRVPPIFSRLDIRKILTFSWPTTVQIDRLLADTAVMLQVRSDQRNSVMTTWNKMLDITKGTLEVFAAGPTRRWKLDQLRACVEDGINQSINEYEIRDAVMRIAARSIVTFDADGALRVNEDNLSAYLEQSMAAQ